MLSFLVLLVYQTLFVKPPPTASPGRCHAGPGQRARRRISEESRGDAVSDCCPETTAEPQAIVAESAARDVIVESDYIRALFSNRGGELKSWTLNRFADDHGRPVDLVPSGAPAAEPPGFALIADDAALTNRLEEARSTARAPTAHASERTAASSCSNTRMRPACRYANSSIFGGR